MSQQIRVNIATRVNNAAIRREERNGREVIIVPSATLPFGIVMNKGMYPEEEIRASYQTLERTPAPFGHPVVNGQYVSARDPEAINGFWVGAYNENVRIDGNRVKLDKVIDVSRAEETSMGKELLAAINNGDPIHTSTGLLLQREDIEGNKDYEWIARNINADHDAILLNEPGAATPEQGVGMMVNGEQVEVINSQLDMIDEDIEHASRMLFELIEHREKAAAKQSRWGDVKNKVVDFAKSLLQSTDEQAEGLSVNQSDEEDSMTVTKEQFEALEAKVDALVTNAKDAPSVSDQITEALKPLTEQLQANAEAEQAKAKAAHEAAVNKVVEAEILEKEVAETMTTNALEALVEKFAKPAASFGVNGSFSKTTAKITDAYSLPEGE